MKFSVMSFYCISSKIEKTGPPIAPQFYGCFKIGPFQTHSGITFANTLRRTLLEDHSRYVFDTIQISGVEHEYSSLIGVRESVIDIIFNLEKLIFEGSSTVGRDPKPQIAFLHFTGPGILRAQHIHLPKDFHCVYPDQYIATLEVDGKLNLKLYFYSKATVQLSSRYPGKAGVPQRTFKKEQTYPGLLSENYLFLDRDFCSIQRVNYTIQSGNQNPKEEFILFEIWTNGSVHPQKAISQAINEILLEFFPYSFEIQKRNKNLLSSLSIGAASAYIKEKAYGVSVQKFLNLEIGNFDFDLNTHIFFKKKKMKYII
uniref:Plastid-encoded RNA polymerase subunit alpha n=1 Tax=Caulerpa lentillifera TaxID=148947 RepID=A0A345HGX2_9CHLO|nr:DNA-directed RNA polymerase subunit alpha [Caulerpa lentillifera]AXG75862.1 DNA-directed RNA polymerase subunit alpha [Caulerpa lentillifera]QKS32274.1 DNA-directed RNA polymerase subunit alpha [Caulerpa lentillifera]QUV75637.1 RNA polymerase subunit alpha [Caulerpa lentillifera]